MKYKAVLFDIFGTLVVIEDMEAELDAWLRRFYDCLKPHGLNLPRETFNKWCLHHVRQEVSSSSEDNITIFERRIQAVYSSAGLKVALIDIKRLSQSLGLLHQL